MTMFYASKLILISQSERSFYRQLVPNLTFFPGYFSMNSTEVIMPRHPMAGASDPLVWLFILSVFHGQSVCKCFGSRRSLLLHNYGGSPGHRSLCSPLCPPHPAHNLSSLGSCWSPGDTPQKPVLPAPTLVAVYSFLPQPQDNLFPKGREDPGGGGLKFSVPKWENQLSESSTLCTQFGVSLLNTTDQPRSRPW